MPNMFKSILTGLTLALLSSSAWAQCSGQPASALVCGNPTAGTTLPNWSTQSSLLDRAFGTTQGTILNRGASVWAETSGPSLGKNGATGGTIVLNGSTSGFSTIGVKAVAGTSTFNLPVGNGLANNVLITDGSGNTSWVTAGSGTVSSVGLSLPSIFTVTNSPVTSTGTLTGTLNTQNDNLVWAGPATGAAAQPTFRLLVGADLPNPSTSSLGGVQAITAVASNWIRSISTSGVPTLSQPAFTDISGTATGAQLPNPSATTLGGIESYVAVANQWINTISTSGVPSSTQPNFTNIAGNAALAQLPSISNNSILGNNSGGSAVPSALTASNVLDMINNVQGDVLYRAAGGAGWVVLAPGTSGQVLTTGGAAANPAWATVTGTGTVTNVATGTGLTGGAITTTGTISFAPITSLDVLANITGGSAVPIPNTMTAILDAALGSTQGNILYRGASVWQVLAPGTNGQVLTQGASTPSWASTGTLTNVTIAAGAGQTVTGTCNISTTGTCTIANNFAVKTDQQTGTSTVLSVNPAIQQQHDSAVKAWCLFSGTATGTNACTAGYNVTSVTRNSTGNYTVTFTTAFATANYACTVTPLATNAGTINIAFLFSPAVGSIGISNFNITPTSVDPVSMNIKCSGRQ